MIMAGRTRSEYAEENCDLRLRLARALGECRKLTKAKHPRVVVVPSPASRRIRRRHGPMSLTFVRICWPAVFGWLNVLQRGGGG